LGSFSGSRLGDVNDLAAVCERATKAIEPLDRKLDEVGTLGQIIGSRRKLAWAFLSDAYSTAGGILILLKARADESPVSADSIEVLVRRVVEQAIVARHVAMAETREVVVRYFKTGQTEFNRSFDETRNDIPDDVKNLPKYAQMCADDPAVKAAYSQLSFTAHPRGAQPYSMREQIGIEELGEKPNELFIRRASKAIDHLALALERLVAAYESIDARGPHEDSGHDTST
jgi:hypothetical protein